VCAAVLGCPAVIQLLLTAPVVSSNSRELSPRVRTFQPKSFA
jgi:hypothetical protein